MALSLLAFVLAAAAQASPPSPARPARLRAPMTSLVDMGDYPPQARNHNLQGRVHFELNVGADGRVTGCAILHSSGVPILDATTCRIMTARARFRPALDASGQPTAGRYDDEINWYLPRE